MVLAESGNHLGQRMACLGVGGGDGQAAGVLITIILRNCSDVLHLEKDFLGFSDNLLSGRRDMGEVLAATNKNLEPQLVLELPDLLADAWLRCIERLGGSGCIQASSYDFAEVAQLI